MEVHGVRAVFKKGAPHNVENSWRTSKPGMPASRQHSEPASAPAAEQPRPPNSDKRRSARRMQLHIKELQAGSRSQQAKTQPKPAEPRAERSASVDSDVRMDDAPAEEVETARRGQKRATVEPMDSAPKPGAVTAAKPQPQQQQQKQRPAVEPTARPAKAAAKQPVAATEQPQQQQQSHAAETAAKSAAAAAKAATTTAPAAAPGQKLKWADRGVLRPDGTVDNADWKCRGCGQPEITGFGGKGEDEVLLGCSCRHPIWHKSGRLDSKISRTMWVCSRLWKAQPPRDDHEP